MIRNDKTIPVPVELHSKIKVFAYTKGVTMKEYLIKLIIKDIEEITKMNGANK